ncbi:MAG: metallophosphoesterase [Sinobacteraceae bacterium]|nr:metallophosphoesterase [Nevskiaceae bacterium]
MNPTLRLNVLSDLHLSRGLIPVPETDADVVVLAGDIARPEPAIEWAGGFKCPVLYVPGNHEFYGGSLAGTVEKLKMLASGSNIQVLDQEEVTLHGVRFLGATLWTDFMLEGSGPEREQAMAKIGELMWDFQKIESGEEPGSLYTPRESVRVFEQHRNWLARKLDEPFAGPTVVITHHAPGLGSIHPRYAGSPINNAYASNLEHLMGIQRVQLWIHGHMHDSFDYVVEGTRVLCNPRGYFKDGHNENAVFDPALVVEVGEVARA